MNFKRGFRRILFVLSVLIALTIAILYFDETYNTWENNRIEYKKAKENYNDITRFWLIWNSDEWIDGKKSVVRLILNSRAEYSPAGFYFGDKTVYFDWYDIFPGIDKNMLNMPLDILDVEAQKSMQQAYDNAEKEIKHYETLGTKDVTEIIPVSISKALLWGIIGGSCTFVVSWFGGLMICRFVQWLIAGFRDA